MGKVKKINDEYFIEFYARGLLYQQKAGSDENVAQKMLSEIEDKINKGEMEAIDRDVDFDIFINSFCDYAKDRFSDTSFKRYVDVAKRFEGFINSEFGESPKLSKVTPIIIEKFQQFFRSESASSDEQNAHRYCAYVANENAVSVSEFTEKTAEPNDRLLAGCFPN